MKDPVPVPVRRRKRRVLLTTRQISRLNNAKRRLDDATREILYERPEAAPAAIPDFGALKPVTTLVDEYFATHTTLAPKTVIERRRSLLQFARYIGPRNLSRELVESYAIELHKSDYSDYMKWFQGAAVAIFLNWLFDSARIPANWRRGIRFQKCPDQKAREPYTADEYRDLVELAGERPLGFIIKLGWHTGMSLVDCCDLLWSEVDMERCIITRKRRKTGIESITTPEFGGELYEALKIQKADTIAALGSIQPGFPVCRHSHDNKHSISVQFKRLVLAAELPYRSFHSFRSTMISHLTEHNTPLAIGMKMVGLKSPKQFIGYSKIKPESIRKQLWQIR